MTYTINGKEHTDLEDENKALSEALDFEREYSKSKIAELEKERDREILKKEHAFKRESYLIAENLELKQLTFRFYNDEEYWIFQDDREDYAESLVCPVVMSAGQFRRLLNVEVKALEEQAKGVNDALNDFMHCAESVTVLVADLDSRVDGLNKQAKALKEQGK